VEKTPARDEIKMGAKCPAYGMFFLVLGLQSSDILIEKKKRKPHSTRNLIPGFHVGLGKTCK